VSAVNAACFPSILWKIKAESGKSSPVSSLEHDEEKKAVMHRKREVKYKKRVFIKTSLLINFD
jgi:hypothetical protein